MILAMSRLIIPASKKFTGLYVFCNKCNQKSKTSLVYNEKCNHPEDKVVYKAIITIPGTKSIRSKNLEAKNVDEAIKQTIDFRNELVAADFKHITINVKEQNPVDLLGCIAMYLDYLENNNVYSHQVKPRTKAHIAQITAYLKKFIIALKTEHLNIKGLLVRHIEDYHVDIWNNYLNDNFPDYSNRTFNRHMDTISEFFQYLINIKRYKLNNFFSSENVARRKVHSRKETISMQEFKNLLNIINPENGIEILSTGERKNHYYDWLKDAFEFGLYSGRRRDEIIYAKFSDIIEENGVPIYIITEDYKFNRRNNLVKDGEKKFNYSPVIKDLYLFLQKIKYEQFKGSDRYLIASESPRKRETIKDDMSKAFTHYYKKLGTGKKLEFKNLRKTYITFLNNFTGGKAEEITGHSGQEIIMSNYHDPKVFNDVLLNFRMIS